jgi:hypothetical protein
VQEARYAVGSGWPSPTAVDETNVIGVDADIDDSGNAAVVWTQQDSFVDAYGSDCDLVILQGLRSHRRELTRPESRR